MGIATFLPYPSTCGKTTFLPYRSTFLYLPTIQVVDAFRFVVEHESFKYLLKTDSDSLVCVKRLVRWLLQKNLPDTAVYAGDPQTYYRHLSEWPQGSKFKDDNYMRVFNQTNYSRYNLGGGYLLSHDVVQHVVTRASEGGFFPGGFYREAGLMPYMEDAFVGRLVGDSADMLDLPVTGR